MISKAKAAVLLSAALLLSSGCYPARHDNMNPPVSLRQNNENQGTALSGSPPKSNRETPGSPTSDKNHAPDKSQFAAPQASDLPYGLRIDQTYTLQASIGARYEPDEISGAGPVFEANKGDSFRITAAKNGYVQVESRDRKGWIPAWYFSKAAALLHTETPYVMIVPRKTPVACAPGQKAREPHLDLWAGKVVQIIKSYKNWVAVRIVEYDAEYGADMWVPKSALIDYDPAKAKEGKLAPNAIIYDEEGRVKREKWSGPAFIVEKITFLKNGPFYQIAGPGGQTGYIRTKDFSPNPF